VILTRFPGPRENAGSCVVTKKYDLDTCLSATLQTLHLPTNIAMDHGHGGGSGPECKISVSTPLPFPMAQR